MDQSERQVALTYLFLFIECDMIVFVAYTTKRFILCQSASTGTMRKLFSIQNLGSFTPSPGPDESSGETLELCEGKKFTVAATSTRGAYTGLVFDQCPFQAGVANCKGRVCVSWPSASTRERPMSFSLLLSKPPSLTPTLIRGTSI